MESSLGCVFVSVEMRRWCLCIKIGHIRSIHNFLTLSEITYYQGKANKMTDSVLV